jgi:hypothetical protein
MSYVFNINVTMLHVSPIYLGHYQALKLCSQVPEDDLIIWSKHVV